MKDNKEEIDKIIRESLSQEEAEFYNELDEQNTIEMLGGLFQGKNSWFIIIVNVVTIVAFIAFVYCVMQFLKVESTNELIKWGAGGFTAIIVISMLKLFIWLQMDKNSILRELKRIEIQVASLSGKITQ